MRSIAAFFLTLLFPLLLAACATAPPPKPDPMEEQLSVLRKQLLELQVLQNDTRAKLDEKTVVIDTLNVKLNTLEEKLLVLNKVPGDAKSSTMTRNSPVKKTAKKKKLIRRQE